MGTSSSYGGRKDRNPLIPRDFIDRDELFVSPEDGVSLPVPDKSKNPEYPSDEQKTSKDDDSKKSQKKDDKEKKNENVINPIKHKTPWKDAKTSFSNYVKGSNNKNIKKTMQAYGRASGSSKSIIISSKGGIATGNALVQFVTNNIHGSDDLSRRIREIYDSNHDTKTTLSLLANTLSPSPNNKESSVAREAITHTLCYLYEYIDVNKLDISTLQNIDVDLQNHILSVYITEYIWGRMLNDLQSRIEEKIFNQNRVKEIENEFRDYIKNRVEVEIRKTQGNNPNIHQINVTQLYENCCEILFYEN
jgi:hypothetical protein